ncbi:MAG TPA: asparagine synthase (glutamine-hydrolyzing) [Saprospiraceae bacterium]|nr:asparagine synthase (glutamine-hydrolyzing) [Saprospiraceae bacterium]
MCGFAGYLLSRNGRIKDTSVINEMIELQRHRGPDDSGVLGINFNNLSFSVADPKRVSGFKHPVAAIFGFNRLSIMDLSSNGHQPMISQDSSVALMMNGEIYNAFKFKSHLKKLGYIFKSNTDTEVALHLYSEYGIEGMLNRLNGMYAFAIADLDKAKIFLARDRMGIKPLYLLRDESYLSFSSELKSFSALPNFSFELDRDGIDEFLLFRNLINKTLFKNIINLDPGTYCSIDEAGFCSFNKFYDINNEGKSNFVGKVAYDSMEEILSQSIGRQMMSDVKLGCQLSGGVDSSLVTYYASKKVDEGRLETVSIILDDPKFSEQRFIDEVTSSLKLKAHQFNLSSDYYFEHIDKASWHFEQPLNHPNTIGIYLLSQRAKNHVTVLLSGEGADEALAGYGRFKDMTLHPYFSKMFLSMLKRNRHSLGSFLPMYASSDNRLILSSAFGTPFHAKKLFKDFNWRKALKERKTILHTINEKAPIKRHRKYELLTYLPDLLIRQDKMSMAHSIENRVPFLDNEMVAQSLNTADSELIAKYNSKKEGKKLLKDISSNVFTHCFAYRKKMGFGIPIRSFFESEHFKDRWYAELLPGIKQRGIFNVDYCEKLFNNRSGMSSTALDSLWLMTTFEIWAKQYLN